MTGGPSAARGGVSAPRPYHLGNVRRRLLDAARRILEAEGRDKLHLRAIASLTGVSAPTVYYHYADKQALLAALALEGFADLRDALEGADGGLTGGPGLGAVSGAYLDFVQAHPALYRLMYEIRDGQPPQAVVDAEDEALEALRRSVRAAMAGKGDAESAAEALWAFGRGAAAVSLSRRGPGLRAGYPRILAALALFDIARLTTGPAAAWLGQLM